MKTSIRFGHRLTCILICVIFLLAASSATALAAPGGHGHGHGPGRGNGNAYGSGANFEYQQASAYFDEWRHDAAALSIKVKPNEMDKFAKMYAKRGGDKESFIVSLTDWTNRTIDRQVEQAQKTRRNDVDLLLRQVDFLVDNVLYWADITGYEIECIYEAYLVDGQVVMIDPLRVVNTRR